MSRTSPDQSWRYKHGIFVTNGHSSRDRIMSSSTTTTSSAKLIISSVARNTFSDSVLWIFRLFQKRCTSLSTALLHVSQIIVCVSGGVAFPYSGTHGMRYDTCHGVLTLFSLETYNLYYIASQLKRLFDPVTFSISPAAGTQRSRASDYCCVSEGRGLVVQQDAHIESSPLFKHFMHVT